MASKIIIENGRVRAVYDDRFRQILEALGDLTVTRASTVEFDHSTDEWFAMHESGQIIARGKNRNEVITAEVKWLEEHHVPHNHC